MVRISRRIAACLAVITLAAALCPAPAAANDHKSCENVSTDEVPMLNKNFAVPMKKAIAACTRVIDAGNLPAKELAIMHDRRAFRWQMFKEYERALEDYTSIIRLGQNLRTAYGFRASMYEKLGDDERAIADYDEEVRHARLARGNVKVDSHILSGALVQRGKLHLKRDALTLALADFREAAKLSPEEPQRAEAAAEAAKVEQQLAARTQTASAVATARQPAEVHKDAPAASALQPERRVALVIGNSAYAAAPRLANPKNDAEAIAAALRRVGFTKVTVHADLDRNQLLDALQRFAAEAEKADWAVVYFAGHGLEVGGLNYLLPVDARLASDRDIGFEAIGHDHVLRAVEGARKLRLVILDACRDNPFLRGMTRTAAVTRSIGRGLAQIEPDGATLVAYAAKHGQVAQDGDGGNSPFVSALVRHMDSPGVEITFLFRKVRDEVLAATDRRQEPYTYGSLPAEAFYFRKP
jgi:tetratricopeptide (TPR) repeat protein